jgi:hypothetical protein
MTENCTLLTWSPDRYVHAVVYCRTAQRCGMDYCDCVLWVLISVATTVTVRYRVTAVVNAKHPLSQMLFYESAACLHGRRQVLRGKYYASVFTHYQPVDSNIWDFNTEVSNRTRK